MGLVRLDGGECVQERPGRLSPFPSVRVANARMFMLLRLQAGIKGGLLRVDTGVQART